MRGALALEGQSPSAQPPRQPGRGEERQQRADGRGSQRLGLRRLVRHGRLFPHRLQAPTVLGPATDSLDLTGKPVESALLDSHYRIFGLHAKLLAKVFDLLAELLLPAFQPGDLLLRAAGRLLAEDLPVDEHHCVSRLGGSLWCRLQDPNSDQVSIRGRLDRQPVPKFL
jgi:hypothetical protein